jgi:hypothetical protein
MNRIKFLLRLTAFALPVGILLFSNVAFKTFSQEAASRTVKPYSGFQVEVLVNGRPLTEYHARGRTYIEALQGAEYELRLRNQSPDRVAVALSVDGLNTIDARHTSASNASKWVIESYQTITISGWQMSSERARRFYFTSERDSYAAKLGQTANFGVISAAFFRERRRIVPVTPPVPIIREQSDRSKREQEAPASQSKAGEAARDKREALRVDEEYAATGIGRSVRHDVRWVHMDLESHPASEVTIRYEYYSALLRLGVVPKHREPNPLWRREDSRGFSPEP